MTKSQGVALRIKQRLAELGMTQTDLAAALGVPRGTVTRWANGRHIPRMPAERAKLAAALKTSEAWLFYGVAQTEAPASLNGARIVREPSLHDVPAMLPTAVYAVVHDYVEQLSRAGLTPDELRDARRILEEAGYLRLGVRGGRERTQDDVIADIRAAWRFLRAILFRQGVTLPDEPIRTELPGGLGEPLQPKPASKRHRR